MFLTRHCYHLRRLGHTDLKFDSTQPYRRDPGQKHRKEVDQSEFFRSACSLNKGLEKWTNFAIWELRAALEEPSQGKSILNYEVITAAEWIFQGGEELFKQTRKEETEEQSRFTQSGSLFPGKAGSLRERWRFWKMRFAEVSKKVDEEAGERAIRAAKKMKDIEEQLASLDTT
jgi:Protein of unknown function (DUF3632)